MSRRRILGGRRQRQGAAVEMAPLIDMVFILLIFFMVSTSFVRESGVEVSRPESAFAERIDDGFVPVGIGAHGTVHVAGRVIAPDSVRDVRQVLEEAGRNRVVIQADRSVPTSLLLQVLDTCRQAGARQVDVSAVQR